MSFNFYSPSLLEIHDFLTNNYLEDPSEQFQLEYPKEIINMYLKYPGTNKTLSLGIQNNEKIMVGYICAIPRKYKYNGEIINAAEVNFMCVHREYRGEGIASKLINQIEKNLNSMGIFKAIYTSTLKALRSKSICNLQCYHRTLNPPKLKRLDFIDTQPRLFYLYTKLPNTTSQKYKRPTKADIPLIKNILNEQNFDFVPLYTEDELYTILLKTPFVYSYISDSGDFISFFKYTIHNKNNDESIFAANMLLTVKSGKSEMEDIMRDALILAKKLQFDCFNCYNSTNYKDHFTKLKFEEGTGKLYSFFYGTDIKKINDFTPAII